MNQASEAEKPAHIDTQDAPSAFQIKIKSQLKSALAHLNEDASDEAVLAVLADREGIRKLHERVLSKSYLEIVQPTANEESLAGNLLGLLQWFSTGVSSCEHANAMLVMGAMDHEFFQKMMHEDFDEESVIDIEEATQYLMQTELDEKDCHHLVEDAAYFANKFTADVNPVFTAEFRVDLFRELLHDVIIDLHKLGGDQEERGPIRRYALAKEILGHNMSIRADAIQDSLDTLGIWLETNPYI